MSLILCYNVILYSGFGFILLSLVASAPPTPSNNELDLKAILYAACPELTTVKEPLPIECANKAHLVSPLCFLVMDYTLQLCHLNKTKELSNTKDFKCPLKLPELTHFNKTKYLVDELSNVTCSKRCSNNKNICKSISSLIGVIADAKTQISDQKDTDKKENIQSQKSTPHVKPSTASDSSNNNNNNPNPGLDPGQNSNSNNINNNNENKEEIKKESAAVVSQSENAARANPSATKSNTYADEEVPQGPRNSPKSALTLDEEPTSNKAEVPKPPPNILDQLPKGQNTGGEEDAAEQAPIQEEGDGMNPVDGDDDEEMLKGSSLPILPKHQENEFEESVLTQDKGVDKVEDLKPGRDDVDVTGQIIDNNGPFQDAPDSHFFSYFLFFTCVSVMGYIAFHNKNKILALVLEGRRGRQGRRRPNSASYRKLDTSLEEAMMNHPTRGPATHVAY